MAKYHTLVLIVQKLDSDTLEKVKDAVSALELSYEYRALPEKDDGRDEPMNLGYSVSADRRASLIGRLVAATEEDAFERQDND